MKLILNTKELYTDNNEFIKQLKCSFDVDWDKMESLDENSRKCTVCKHAVIDTSKHTDSELIAMVRENPKTCFMLELNQENLKII